MDNSLKNKIANLENNICADVQVGSIMQDKSKLVKIYTDTKLDMNLLNVLLKARELGGDQDHRESILMNFTGSHALKVIVVPRDASSGGCGPVGNSSRLSIIPPKLGERQSSSMDKVPMLGFTSFSRLFSLIHMTQGKDFTVKEAVLLKKLPLHPFIRIDKSTLMINAYHKLLTSNSQYAILSHHSMVDIGFVSMKDVVKYLAHKYIPD